MAFWSGWFGGARAAPAARPAAALRHPSDARLLDVQAQADAITVQLADGHQAADHPAGAIGTSIEHYDLRVTNSGMRDVTGDESAALMDFNPDMAAGITAVRVFAYPLVLARDGQRYPIVFDVVRDMLAAIPQPMRLSHFKQVQKDSIAQIVADMEARELADDEGPALHNLKGMLHWSY